MGRSALRSREEHDGRRSRRILLWAGASLGIALAVAGPTVGQAPGPPAATTGEADDVHVDRATLHGSVHPNGAPTTYRFEYGKGTGYGSSTGPGTVPAGTEPAAVEATVSNLEPGTTYHYRVVATNGAGTAVGADRVFTSRDPRLDGAYRGRVRVTGGGDPFGQSRGDRFRRTYDLRTSCDGSLCPKLRLVRAGQRGRFRSTLGRRGPGSYAGTERFRGRCDNGLRFRSKARVRLRGDRLAGDTASRVRGRLAIKLRGCASGHERAQFKGSLTPG